MEPPPVDYLASRDLTGLCQSIDATTADLQVLSNVIDRHDFLSLLCPPVVIVCISRARVGGHIFAGGLQSVCKELFIEAGCGEV